MDTTAASEPRPSNDQHDQLPMRASASIDALVAALARAQGAFGPIEKDRTGRIATKAGAATSYRYADLATVLAVVRPPLVQNELAILQPATVEASAVRVATVLAHSSGQWVATELAIPIADAADARSVASALTYGRRYSLVALLGLAPCEDDDDAAATVTRPAPTADRTTPPKTSPATATAEPITAADRKQLFAIARDRGWSEPALKEWLVAHGVASTQQLTRARYDALIADLPVASAPDSTTADVTNQVIHAQERF